MALIWVDPFDQYSAVADLTTSDRYSGQSGSVIETTTVKDGRASLSLGSADVVWKNSLGTYTGRIVVAFWLRIGGTPAATRSLFQFYRAGSSIHDEIEILTNRRLQITNDNTNSVTGTEVLATDTWYFIEYRTKYTDSAAANDIVLRIDENEDATVTASTDWKSGADPGITGFAMRGSDSEAFIDSLVIYDDSAGQWDADTFKGQYRMQTSLPDGNGNSNQFTGSDADSTDNYLHVDEEPNDGDTSYNESNTVGHIDLYGHESVTGSPPSIFGVQSFNMCRKTSGGARTHRQVCRSGGTNYFGSSQTTNQTYTQYYTIYETDPNTGSAWTEANVNSAEFGIEVES